MYKTQALASESKLPLKIKLLHIFRLVVATIVRFIFELYYGTEKNRVPALKDDYLKLPAIEIAKKIRSKEVSSVEVVEAYIRRIKDVNPILNCVVEDRYDLALKEATLADEEIRKADTEYLLKEKPFLGVPFTTKDSIGVKDMHLTAGVYNRKDVIAEKDADVIHLLKQKGAIVLAITNVPEICMWWDTSNTIYGRTYNPYDTTKIVGGSSGGEACLQTVAGSAFGIGSDIGGSIRIPSYFNGIFGHKPSRTIVSNSGTFPCPTLELLNGYLGVGPMTRHAVDLKPLLKIISGNKSALLKLDEPVDFKKVKIFYQYESGVPVIDKVNKQIKNAMKKAIDHLAKKTVANSEETKIELLKKSALIWLSTMKDVTSLAELITGKNSICTTVKEIIFSLIGRSNNTFIALATALTEKTGVQLNTKEYKKYLKLREELEKVFTSMLGDNGVFIFPTHPTAAPYKNEPLVRPFNFSYTAAINCMGLPATQIPLGLNKEGLPIGLQVVANHNNDRLCLAVAEELEKAFGGWIDPSQK